MCVCVCVCVCARRNETRRKGIQTPAECLTKHHLNVGGIDFTSQRAERGICCCDSSEGFTGRDALLAGAGYCSRPQSVTRRDAGHRSDHKQTEEDNKETQKDGRDSGKHQSNDKRCKTTSKRHKTTSKRQKTTAKRQKKRLKTTSKRHNMNYKETKRFKPTPEKLNNDTHTHTHTHTHTWKPTRSVRPPGAPETGHLSGAGGCVMPWALNASRGPRRDAPLPGRGATRPTSDGGPEWEDRKEGERKKGERKEGERKEGESTLGPSPQEPAPSQRDNGVSVWRRLHLGGSGT